MSSIEESLRAIVEHRNDEEAEDLLDYLNMPTDPDTLTEEEMSRVHAGLEEIARGAYLTLEELQQRGQVYRSQ